MKKLLFVFALGIAAPATVFAQAQTATKPIDKNAPRFQFKQETHDFGTLTDKKDGECDFEFKNVGKTPLVISNAHASCGCTVPQFPTAPIAPGKSEKIHVVFHTAGKNGAFDKTVFIKSNAPSNVASEEYELHIKGSVTPAKG